MNTPDNPADDELKTPGEIRLRIAEKCARISKISRENDYKNWLALYNAINHLKRRLEKITNPDHLTSSERETMNSKAYQEAKERYEKKAGEAGDKWWEMLD